MTSRERELAKRDAELNATEQLAASDHEHSEKRRQRLDKMESTLQSRLRELEERESAIALREARIEADRDIREDKLEQRESELVELDARLERKQRDLAFYVGQLQGKVQTPDDDDWWQKQLGSQPAA